MSGQLLRPVIGLDGCFLKTETKGQLLSAVGRDGNNQMFPISWAVVEGENQDSWTWFIKLLMQDLGIFDGLSWTVISDQQKVSNCHLHNNIIKQSYLSTVQLICPNNFLQGLENAVSYLLPHAEHTKCARHIFANWKKKGHSTEALRVLRIENPLVDRVDPRVDPTPNIAPRGLHAIRRCVGLSPTRKKLKTIDRFIKHRDYTG